MIKKREIKGQLNLSFGWLFAIIVGATILFLAILGATKVIKIGQQGQQAAGAREIGVLTNPLETGFESAVSVPVQLRIETRIFNKCYLSGNFGKQGIQTSELSFNRWALPGAESSFENKYLFSKSPYAEGKKFYIFSKPFEFPFKVADLIYLTSENEKYCFDGAPEEIREELEQINQENLLADCSDAGEKTTKICFDSATGCDIKIDYDSGYLQKNREKIYFETDALMYGAIFSDPDIYKCQVKRLMKRAKSLAEIYLEKEILLSQKNCNSELTNDLDLLIAGLENQEDYRAVSGISELAERIQNKNEYSQCPLW